MQNNILVSDYVAAWMDSPFVDADMAPWQAVEAAEALIRKALSPLGPEYQIDNEFAVHRSTTIESGVVLKGPGIIGRNCFVATGAYLRGGTYLGEGCIIGPGSELKTSFMFPGSKIAHLNFVGNSILGSGVNVEAGAVIANYRNELVDKTIRVLYEGGVIDTGVCKFGSLIGDQARIGANAVLAPGALIAPGTNVGRLQLVDQYPHELL